MGGCQIPFLGHFPLCVPPVIPNRVDNLFCEFNFFPVFLPMRLLISAASTDCPDDPTKLRVELRSNKVSEQGNKVPRRAKRLVCAVRSWNPLVGMITWLI